MAGHLEGKTALVTGANSGVGLALTRRLLADGVTVIALIRSEFPAGDAALNQAREDQRLRVYQADFSDFTGLRRALQAIKVDEPHLDLLFNNAAAAVSGIQRSPQGRELHFEVNTVVPYIILMELTPLLAAGSLKTVINTSSNALLYVKQFSLNLLERPVKYKAITGPYGASKLALSLWTTALARTAAADGIEIRSVCPGPNKTKMTGSRMAPLWLRLMRRLFFQEPSEGARRVYAAAVGGFQGQPGIFINKGQATPVKFAGQAAAVLDLVDGIYRREFLGASA